ncbi:MAG TPA: hypothetical protein VFJ91_11040 [Gaiellaceae bacterium]|nr:hypothetical protein [Gaiellaceae bacterium]
MPSQEERRAENESTFRDANERIREATDRLQAPMERYPFVCECADTRCREVVLLSLGEYERVRDEATHFIVVPGHEGDAEVALDDTGYAVVRKQGVAGAVARERDPRSRA